MMSRKVSTLLRRPADQAFRASRPAIEVVRAYPPRFQTTTDASRRLKLQPWVDRPGGHEGEKKIGGRPSVPELAALGEAHRPGPPTRGRGVDRDKHPFACMRRCRIAPARDPVACCGGGAVAGEAGRATSPIAGTRDTASSPSHAIMRATAAAPYRVPALVVGRSPYVATPASRRRSSPRRAFRAR